MKEKDKNRKTNLSGFLDYRNDNLKNSERNIFERELQKDPFAMEAEEGFSSTNPELIRSDMDLLNKKIKLRTGRSRSYILYRIAASIAVLMVVSTVFFMVQRNTPAKHEKIAGPNPEALVIKEEPGEKDNKKMEAPALPVTAENMKPEVKTVAAPKKSAEKPGEVSTLALNAGEVNELIVADAAVSKTKTDSAIKVTAESEAAVRLQNVPAGYGDKKARSLEAAPVSRSEAIRDEATARHIAAEPVNGMESFYKYIEENIRRPDTLERSGQATVIISFIVKISGNPDRIIIVESPGQPFSDEAVRLIKKGPRWKPASENGVIKEEEVRVKVVFK